MNMDLKTQVAAQQELKVEDLHAYYGQSHILQGVSLRVDKGEVVSLLGRNGAGKTTTFRAIVGLISKVKGSVKLGDQEFAGMETHKIACKGIAYVPSGRRSFAQLTVVENLQIAFEGQSKRRDQQQLEFVYDMFPALRRRMNTAAGVLSGGENQMLKMACAFLTEPTILLLDEPTEGLAPIVVSELAEHIQILARAGVGILLAEQNANFAFSLSQRAYVLHKGVVQLSGSVEELTENEDVLIHLGI